MTHTIPSEQVLLEAIEAMRRQLDALSERVAALESPRIAVPVAAAPAPPPPPQEEAITEELLLAISAAVAAFLGKRPHIRQIRLIGSGAWAQQGRVSIQASHALAVRHE